MHLNMCFAQFGNLNHRNCLESSSSVGTKVSVGLVGSVVGTEVGSYSFSIETRSVQIC